MLAQIDLGELRNWIVDAGEGATRAAVVAVEGGKVWVLVNTGNYAQPDPDARGQLMAIDPATNEVVSAIDLGSAYPYDLAFDGDLAWIVDILGARVVAIRL